MVPGGGNELFTCTNESLEAIMLGLDISPGDTVLSICGSGDQAIAMIEKASIVRTVDVDSRQIRYAKSQITNLKEGMQSRFWGDGTWPVITNGNRNNYFFNRKRLAVITPRLDRIEFREGDIFDLKNLQGLDLEKVYLSNCGTYPEGASLSRIPEEFAEALPTSSLVYLVTSPKLGSPFPTIPNCLELVKNRTKKARKKEKGSGCGWVPHVYRKL